MKRRNFGILAGSSMLALQAGRSEAQSAPTSALGAGLTPMGSEIAGNADGSIPAWTGGMTTLPAGYKPNDYIEDLFPGEQPLVVIDASNMDQHKALLSEGVMAMMTKYGFKIEVYPTHRTAAFPQYVYDNIAKNAKTAQFCPPDPASGRFGVQNCFGGVPFPILDTSNPYTAGAQVISNHCLRYFPYAAHLTNQSGWVMASGNLSMGYMTDNFQKVPYYNPAGEPPDYDGTLAFFMNYYTGPANEVGEETLVRQNINPYKVPQMAWELLNGQGRVRRAPEIAFDTPAPQTDGITGYDEFYTFSGSLERYDWKLIGRQEMYIPYNNNQIYAKEPHETFGPHFIDPGVVRFEKHRCWVVEATLHPGERNVIAKRRFYVDEDSWMIGLGECWDANGTMFKVNFTYNYVRPDIPAVICGNNCVVNLQTGDYACPVGQWGYATQPHYLVVADIPNSKFDPNTMAAAAQY